MIVSKTLKKKCGSNDYDLRLQMCSRNLPSTLRLSYDCHDVRCKLDVSLLQKEIIVHWS